MRLIHSAAGLCMMLLACSVHTETKAASQKVNVGAADAQERAGVGRRGLDGDWPVSTDNLRAHGDVNDDTIQGANETIHGPGAGQEMQDEAEGSRGWSTGGATPSGVTGVQEEYEGGAHTRRGAEGSRGWSTGCATPGGVTGEEDRDGCGDAAQMGKGKRLSGSLGGDYDFGGPGGIGQTGGVQSTPDQEPDRGDGQAWNGAGHGGEGTRGEFRGIDQEYPVRRVLKTGVSDGQTQGNDREQTPVVGGAAEGRRIKTGSLNVVSHQDEY